MIEVRSIWLLALFYLASTVTFAAARPIPKPPALQASGYLLADFNSGAILAEDNAHQQIEPASITKIMTAYVVYRALAEGSISESDQVLVSKKAWQMEGSRMFIEVDTQVGVADLLKGLAIQSGNDAAVALAEHVAGSEEGMVVLMNRQAQRLGMTESYFANVTGLPAEGHVMSATDIMILVKALITEFPDRYKLYSEKSFKYNEIKQDNRNRLLWLDKSVDGVKTGHTESAGYCLVSSAEREGMRLIAVVLGTQSDNARTSQSRTLINYGYRFYETRRLYPADESLADARVWKGQADNVKLGLEKDLYVTFPRGQYDQLDAKLDRQRIIEAPIPVGASLGEVTVSLDDEVLTSRPLIAMQGVEEGGFFRNIVDSVLLCIAYLNGRFQLLERTSIPVLDRGFIFGDGIYEVVPVYGGKPFQSVGIEDPLTELQWVQTLRDLVEQNDEDDVGVYIQVTRGVAPRQHAFPEDTKPTVFMMVQDLPKDAPADDSVGLSAMTSEDFRWMRCDIKSVSLLANVMLKQMAVEQGADEMILLRNGYVTEGASSNVFAVVSGEVLTPPLSGLLLGGITRRVVVDLCRKHSMPLREAALSLRSLQHADEIWLTSSTKGVAPVVSLDGRPVNEGMPGPVWQQMDSWYRQRAGQVSREYGSDVDLAVVTSDEHSKEELIEFPCEYEVKVMGLDNPEFHAEVKRIITTHVADVADEHFRLKPSAKGKYVSVSASVYVESRTHLETLY
ncbi:unnamed protein product, partial [Cyprideis torosa]